MRMQDQAVLAVFAYEQDDGHASRPTIAGLPKPYRLTYNA
jgi:hypothetical protein